MYKLIACLVLAAAVGASADACDKPECQDYNVKCVGEGAYCTRDINSGPLSNGNGCQPNSRSACFQCGDASLTCHHNKCIKKVELGVPCCPPGRTCDADVQHNFCLDNLSCENATGFSNPARGTCNNSRTVFLAVGENCDPLSTTQVCYTGGGSNVVCDVTARRCIFVNAATGLTNEGSCYSTVDCKPGFYCPGGATTSAPTSCTPAYATNSATRGKPCGLNNASQCGYIMQCMADNALESSTNYLAYTCQLPYSRKAEEACSSSSECGDGTICSNNWCTPVQGPCLGRQCNFNSDCTNSKGTMTCSCPPMSIGGGYQRCIATAPYQNQWYAKYMFDNYLRSYVQCLADNNCPLVSSLTQTSAFKCSVDNCQSLYDRYNNVVQGRSCSNTEPGYGRSYPSSASTATPAAVSLIALAAAVFAAQHKH